MNILSVKRGEIGAAFTKDGWLVIIRNFNDGSLINIIDTKAKRNRLRIICLGKCMGKEDFELDWRKTYFSKKEVQE